MPYMPYTISEFLLIMKKRIFIFLIVFLELLIIFSWPVESALPSKQSKNSGAKKTKQVESEAGLNIPAWSVAIDALYDPQLDDLIPGYKILNVVVTNRGTDVIYFDTGKDRWQVHEATGRGHKGINHLRLVDENLWNSLPVGLKNELEYPQMVRGGHTSKIDLLFRSSVELANFRDLVWNSVHFKKEFLIKMPLEKNLEWEPKEEPLPKTKADQQAIEKYEGGPEGGKTVEEDKDELELQRREELEKDRRLEGISIPMD